MTRIQALEARLAEVEERSREHDALIAQVFRLAADNPIGRVLMNKLLHGLAKAKI